jgi:hypothetical protein
MKVVRDVGNVKITSSKRVEDLAERLTHLRGGDAKSFADNRKVQ